MEYVIIGGSAAGINACESIRSKDSKSKVTLISDEEYALYSRCLLTYYISGAIDEGKLKFKPEGFFKDLHIDALLGVRAESLDIGHKKVALSNGKKVSFDKLLIATGSRPQFPSINGIDKKGAFGIRTIKDARGVLSILDKARNLCVLGGGLVGLRAAYALKKRGLDVKVIVKSRQILSQMLDERAASIIEEAISKNGIQVLKGLEATEILGKDCVSGIKLDNGETLECQIVVVGKGVEANIDIAKDAGIKTEWGISADSYLMTDKEAIFAAGDCAQTMDIAQGISSTVAIWPAACQQGRIAGLNMSGEKVIYDGSLGMNSIEFFGVPAISIGISRIKKEGYEEIYRLEPGIYRKIVLKDGRIVGATFVNDVDKAGVVGNLIKRKIDVSKIKDVLLEKDFDFAKVLPMVKSMPDKFKEDEFKEIAMTFDY